MFTELKGVRFMRKTWEPMPRKRRGEIKKSPDKGTRKIRPCLGPDCHEEMYTSEYNRICQKCKDKLRYTEEEFYYDICFK